MKLEEIVEKLDESLLDNHRFDVSLFAKLTQIQRAAGILHDDRPICPFLRPHFFARSKYNEIKSAVEELHLAFESLTDAALANDEIMS